MDAIKIEFYMYAENKESKESAIKAFADFIEDCRLNGKIVTAEKVVEYLPKWKENTFVRNAILSRL